MTRAEILQAAEKCVTQDRQDDYGSAENSFGEIAAYWKVYLGVEIKAEDVGIMMALMKIARITTGRYKADSYIDACGYLSISGEIAGKEGQE